MIRFLHLSDLHLGWQPGFLKEDVAKQVQEQRDKVLHQAVNYALAPEHNIDLLIIAGDLFETHAPEQSLTEQVIRELNRCLEAGIQVVTVPGNHDEITYRDSVYRREQNRWPGILVTNPLPEPVAVLDIKGHSVYVYSLAFTGGITTGALPLKDFPRLKEKGFHLAVFHGSYNLDGGDRSLPLDREALAGANYDYVALGHFHRYQQHFIGQGIGVYPGIAAGKGFHDPGQGELLVGEWQEGQGIRLQKIPVEVPVFEQRILDVSLLSDPAELVALLEEQADPEAMVRVELQGVAGFLTDTGWLLERCQGGYRHLEIQDASYYLSESQLTQLAQEKTVTGFFLDRMRKRLAEADSEEEKRLIGRALTKGILALKGGNPGA